MILDFVKRLLGKKKKHRQEALADFHTTIIRIDDNFISQASVILDEDLVGNIYSLKEVIVESTARILGNVSSATSTISGHVTGNIITIEHADITSTAVITGCIRASSISITAGAVINGTIYIEGSIDDSDLLQKVAARTPVNLRTGAEIGPVPHTGKEIPADKVKPEIRPSQGNKRPSANVARDKSQAPAPGGVGTNSWY